MAGFVDDATLVDLLADAVAVVYSPLDEDYGYVTLQAFLAGVPVITAADSGGVLEWVTDGVTGLVTDGSAGGDGRGDRRARRRSRPCPADGCGGAGPGGRSVVGARRRHVGPSLVTQRPVLAIVATPGSTARLRPLVKGLAAKVAVRSLDRVDGRPDAVMAASVDALAAVPPDLPIAVWVDDVEQLDGLGDVSDVRVVLSDDSGAIRGAQ